MTVTRIRDEEEVKRRIEELTERVCGNSKNIVNEPIVLTVYSSTVPNLTLVDLPGITRVAIEGQPENIEEITKKMAARYCQDSKTIILCVIPANQDLSTQDSINMARRLDPQGNRTLGVLTKVDIMDEGTDCSRILRNEEIKLKLGYVAVKGRSQMDIKRNMKVGAAKKKEMEFFARHPVYSSMPSHLLGTTSLINSLSNVFFSVVKAELPKIKNEIMMRKKDCKDKLELIGEDFPETEDLKLELIFHLVRRFKQMFETEVNGKYSHENEKETRKSRSKKKSLQGQDRISFQIQEIFEKFFAEFTKPGFKVCHEYKDEDIRKAIDYYHGDSIPGFPSFDSFLYLVDPMLKKLNFPILEMLKECSTIIESIGSEMIRLVFGKFVRLQEIIMRIFSDFVKKRTGATRRILLNIIACEENYIFTNDLSMYDAEVDDKTGLRTAIETNNILIYELRVKVNRYFNIVVRNLRDSIPKIIGRFLMQKVNERLEFEILNKLNQINYCLDTLEENANVTDERKKLKKMYSVLSKAEDLLLNSFRMTFDELPSSMRRPPPMSKIREMSEDEQDYEEIDNIYTDIINFNQKLIGKKPRRKPEGRPRDKRRDLGTAHKQDARREQMAQEQRNRSRSTNRGKGDMSSTNISRKAEGKKPSNLGPSKPIQGKNSNFDLFVGKENPERGKKPRKARNGKYSEKGGDSIFDNFNKKEKKSTGKIPKKEDALLNLWDNFDSGKVKKGNPPPGMRGAKPKKEPKKHSEKVSNLFGI